MSGLCKNAYRRGGKRGKIVCKKTEQLCAHQYWCDLAVEFRHTSTVDRCPGKEEQKEA